MKAFSLKNCLAVFFVLLLAAWVWWPRVTVGLPYIYDEDEGHHFNRVVNMVKTGDYNPHYFLKPSLHFYLRMPAVALGFLHEVSRGRASKLADLETRDPYGLGGFAFSTSHPGVLKSVRLVSLLCGLVCLVLLVQIIYLLTSSLLLGLVAASGLACSPLFMDYAGQVGVDIVVAMFVLSVVLCALHGVVARSRWLWLLLASLLAGLAVSSKYNAAPIVVVPLLLALRGPYSVAAVPAVLGLMVAGFLLGSPFALVSLPLFLDHVAYEIWHYGVEGHVGHMHVPGMGHALRYLHELSQDSLGLVGLVLGLAGWLVALYRHGYKGLVVVFYPVLFVAYMSTQKAHFLRNMVGVVPFLWLGVALLLHELWKKRSVLAMLLVAVVLIPPALAMYQARSILTGQVESRFVLEQWLRDRADSQLTSVAISGSVELALAARQLPGVAVIDPQKLNVQQLYQQGFDYLVTLQGEVPELQSQQLIPGVSESQRIPQNPAIAIHSLNQVEQVVSPVSSEIFFEEESSWHCKIESLCWLQNRKNLIRFNPKGAELVTLELRVMTPWEGQELVLDGIKCSLSEVGVWSICRFVGLQPRDWLLEIKRVDSLAEWHRSADERRLGVAVAEARFSVSTN